MYNYLVCITASVIAASVTARLDCRGVNFLSIVLINEEPGFFDYIANIPNNRRANQLRHRYYHYVPTYNLAMSGSTSRPVMEL